MKDKETTFNDAMSEVELILEKMEGGEMNIDELAASVKRASGLLKLCQKKLKATEEEIENIFREE